MIDKVLCPYCGAEMNLDRQDDGYVFGAAYYVCQECGSTSPTANTEAAALAAARARYLPPNRPLTLEEAKGLDADEVGDISCLIWPWIASSRGTHKPITVQGCTSGQGRRWRNEQTGDHRRA